MFGKSKKIKPLNEYSENWVIAQGVHDGKATFIRIQLSLRDAIGHPEYPYQIGVAVPLKDPTTEGLPKNSELEALNAIEDLLYDTITDATLVATITTNGMREFVFYAKDWKPEIFEAQVKMIEAKQGTHRLQFMMQQDSSWSTFKSLLS